MAVCGIRLSSPKQIMLHVNALDSLEGKIFFFLMVWNVKVVARKYLSWKIILNCCNAPAKKPEQNEPAIHYGPN